MVARPQSMPVSTAPDTATDPLDEGWSDESDSLLPSAVEVRVTAEALAPAKVPDFGSMGCLPSPEDGDEAPVSREGDLMDVNQASHLGIQAVDPIERTMGKSSAATRNGSPGGRSGRPRQITMAGGFAAPAGEVSESPASPTVVLSGRSIPSSLPPDLEDEDSAWDTPPSRALTPASVLPVGEVAELPKRASVPGSDASRRRAASAAQPHPGVATTGLGTTGVRTVPTSNTRATRTATRPASSESSSKSKSEPQPTAVTLRRVESVAPKQPATAVAVARPRHRSSEPVSAQAASSSCPRPDELAQAPISARANDLAPVTSHSGNATSTPVLAPAIDITIEPTFQRTSADAEARDEADASEQLVEPSLMSALAWEQQRTSAGRRTVLWCSAAALTLLAIGAGWAYVNKRIPAAVRPTPVVQVQPAAVPTPKPAEAPDKGTNKVTEAAPATPAAAENQLPAVEGQPKAEEPKAEEPKAEEPKAEEPKPKTKARRRVSIGAANRIAPPRMPSTDDSSRQGSSDESSAKGEVPPPDPQVSGSQASGASKEPLTTEL